MDILSVLLAKQLGKNGKPKIVNYDTTTYELDASWQEIFDTVKDGNLCFISDKQLDIENAYAGMYLVTMVNEYVDLGGSPIYYVHAVGSDDRTFCATWMADTPQDFPVFVSSMG